MIRTFTDQLRQWAEADDLQHVTPQQQALTERYVLPCLDEIDRLMNRYRDQVDLRLADHARPRPGRKPYPEGYCKEITQQMMADLQKDFAHPQVDCIAKLAEFIRQGGVFKRIWGDLRGCYFQNAIQVGSLYLDVANDTVDITKPRVEILSLADSGFKMIHDISHFVKVATAYWGGQFFPNTVLPMLAPVLPILHVKKSGIVRLEADTRAVFARNILQKSRTANAYVKNCIREEKVMPPTMAAQWLDQLSTLTGSALLKERCVHLDKRLLVRAFKRAGKPNAFYQTPEAVNEIIAGMNAVHANANTAITQY
ncbi:MAG: hypothetical protein HQL54_14545 [Magnetococcales bacterium]|nr:hypothetical protein [Magnetococcales bacterium]